MHIQKSIFNSEQAGKKSFVIRLQRGIFKPVMKFLKVLRSMIIIMQTRCIARYVVKMKRNQKNPTVEININ